MTLTRGTLLTIGPFLLVAICYAVAAPGSSSSATPVARAGFEGASARVHQRPILQQSDLTTDCDRELRQLLQKLPADWNGFVHAPFVLAGDCSPEALERAFQETITPTVAALRVQYFDGQPQWPITIILCSSEDSFRTCHRQLGEPDRSEFSGIYVRDQHRVVVNVASGDGTLAHELTHALAHADFPDLPEWLDEGIASLHEECEFSTDGLRLCGLENWRRQTLKEALARGKARTIASLSADRFGSPTHAQLDYAQARYFCLFLQSRHLLEPFYRKCRHHGVADPTGMDSLCDLFGVEETSEIDRQFVSWFHDTGNLKNVAHRPDDFDRDHE